MTCVAEHPIELVNVTVVVPTPFAVTCPLAFIDAIVLFEEVHGFITAGFPLPDKMVVNPKQIEKSPPIIGSEFTVITSVSTHPFALLKVIVAVPCEIPVTTPFALTAAIETFEETHGLTAFGVDVEDNVVVLPWQIEIEPVIVGIVFMVMSCVSVQPSKLVNVIIEVPFEIPLTTPNGSTVATKTFEDTHGLNAAGKDEAESAVELPSHIEKFPVMVGSAFTAMFAI